MKWVHPTYSNKRRYWQRNFMEMRANVLWCHEIDFIKKYIFFNTGKARNLMVYTFVTTFKKFMKIESFIKKLIHTGTCMCWKFTFSSNSEWGLGRKHAYVHLYVLLLLWFISFCTLCFQDKVLYWIKMFIYFRYGIELRWIL